MTAMAIADAQNKKPNAKQNVEVIQLALLREQDFGSFECVPWSSKKTELTSHKLPKPEDVGFKPKETTEAMARRADEFLDDCLLPQLALDEEQENVVAVVSHGLFLAMIWRLLLSRFGEQSVKLGPEISNANRSRPIEYLPGWSNTGYLGLDIAASERRVDGPRVEPGSIHTEPPTAAPSIDEAAASDTAGKSMKLAGYTMTVLVVNSKQHLSNLKRARGGIGSSTYDAKQKSLETFFKKPKVAPNAQCVDL